MKISRNVNQGGIFVAQKRLKFCLDQLENAVDFNDELDWSSDIVYHCTLEEILGALVSAEQYINEQIDDLHFKSHTL